eukprot:TRINITY_DN52941_c0_g1_i4.p1 TRINITY_DN52941_c0_g1~~TRINITY_DN52941_c0_g1_i4.p1  ORF type:complete len:538 (+),score=85.11 TRINITY_DN52941_c0_g1_i4:70-1683(+)
MSSDIFLALRRYEETPRGVLRNQIAISLQKYLSEEANDPIDAILRLAQETGFIDFLLRWTGSHESVAHKDVLVIVDTLLNHLNLGLTLDLEYEAIYCHPFCRNFKNAASMPMILIVCRICVEFIQQSCLATESTWAFAQKLLRIFKKLNVPKVLTVKSDFKCAEHGIPVLSPLFYGLMKLPVEIMKELGDYEFTQKEWNEKTFSIRELNNILGNSHSYSRRSLTEIMNNANRLCCSNSTITIDDISAIHTCIMDDAMNDNGRQHIRESVSSQLLQSPSIAETPRNKRPKSTSNYYGIPNLPMPISSNRPKRTSSLSVMPSNCHSFQSKSKSRRHQRKTVSSFGNNNDNDNLSTQSSPIMGPPSVDEFSAIPINSKNNNNEIQKSMEILPVMNSPSSSQQRFSEADISTGLTPLILSDEQPSRQNYQQHQMPTSTFRKNAVIGRHQGVEYRVFLPACEISTALEVICNSLEMMENPIAQAFFLFRSLVHIVHPFKDGNGRLGRLMADIILKRHGLPALVTSQHKLLSLNNIITRLKRI